MQKALAHSIEDIVTETEALSDGIRALDKEVAEATETREDERETFETG